VFVVVAYDVGKRRIPRVHKTCSKYLRWVQRSVFEGFISEEKLERLRLELKYVTIEGIDDVRIYVFTRMPLIQDGIVFSTGRNSFSNAVNIV